VPKSGPAISGYTLNWKGAEIKSKVKRAVSRSMIAWAETAVYNMKTRVHRLTGTLSRSIHAAPRDYQGSGDEGSAASPPKGSAMTLPAMGEIPQWVGDGAVVRVGSWISYAKYENDRGGDHQFLEPAVEAATSGYHAQLEQAMREEGFAKA
jgi:hypothetical protein